MEAGQASWGWGGAPMPERICDEARLSCLRPACVWPSRSSKSPRWSFMRLRRAVSVVACMPSLLSQQLLSIFRTCCCRGSICGFSGQSKSKSVDPRSASLRLDGDWCSSGRQWSLLRLAISQRESRKLHEWVPVTSSRLPRTCWRSPIWTPNRSEKFFSCRRRGMLLGSSPSGCTCPGPCWALSLRGMVLCSELARFWWSLARASAVAVWPGLSEVCLGACKEESMRK
mmetsp:Transcript_14911/g.42835  ORF Transcript_14911/g.42835 Transcript_14911/m.42835 type:complete len:228 (+) Transcript_14911:262-945(+)